MIYDLALTAGGIVWSKYSKLKKLEYFSLKDREEYHFHKLKYFLLCINEHVPYYNNLFKKIGFNPFYDFNDIKTMQSLPILTKDELISNLSLFKSKYSNDRIKFKTSGSTGTPLEVSLSARHWIGEQANVWRHFEDNGYRFRQKMAIFRSYFPKSGDPIYKIDRIRNFYYFSPLDLTNTNIELYLKIINDHSIDAIRGYPSSLSIIANYIIKNGTKLKPIKFIHAASEVLEEEDRLKIELAFNCKVTNHYGQVEGVASMGSCNKSNYLHVFEDHSYTEFLPLSHSNYSRIIGTNFSNLSMPLLRYDTKDLAVLKNRTCKCGRTSRLVNSIVGRSSDTINIRNHKVPVTLFYSLLSKFDDIVKWQIVQHKSEELDFIFLLNNNSSTQDLLIKNEILTYFQDKNIEVNFKFNGEFLQSSNGKMNPYYYI